MTLEGERAGGPAGGLTVAAEDIRRLGALASDAGISLSDILQKLEIPSDVLNGGRRQALPLTDYFRLLEQLSIAAHDETCQLSERPLLPGTTNFVLSNLSKCENLHDAMKLMAESYNILHGGRYNRVELRDGFLVYVIDDTEFPYTLGHDDAYIHFTMECVLIFLHGMLSFIVSGNLSPELKKVYSKRRARSEGSRHLAFWDVPVRYKSANYALFYDAAAAALPVTFSADDLPSSKSFYNKVTEMIERRQSAAAAGKSTVGRVRDALAEGAQGQPQVARRLGVSVATLRRRLKDEDASFRVVRHQVLNEVAKSLLEERCHVSDVAEQLGFSDFRSFTRAFKSWNGMTPRSYVETLTKQG